MDNIKVAKVIDVTLIRLGIPVIGTLHLTTHHMIFRQNDNGREIWVCYPVISEIIRHPYHSLMGYSRIRIVCKDFTFLALNFPTDESSRNVYDSLLSLSSLSSVEKLYCFLYKPGSLEKIHNGWNVYDPIKEYRRMGALLDTREGDNGQQPKWRVTHINKHYEVSKSYPSLLVVPEAISDTVLHHAAKYRSKGRFPVLSYYHKFNKCTITRSSQPLVGLKKNRSVQDEKLINAIFSTTCAPTGVISNRQENLFIDARPTTNAMAQTALGGGTESMDSYKPAKKCYLGIDNVHVMRDSINKVIEALRNGDVSQAPPNQELLYKSHWLKHVSNILQGAVLAAHQVHYEFSHVMIHCSDGWDRTAQLTSLAQIMLDPYFRTIDGFIVLVEKEWLSFGHRFAERTQVSARGKVRDFSLSQQAARANDSAAISGASTTDSSGGDLSSSNNYSRASGTNFLNNVTNLLPDGSGGKAKYSGPIFQQFLDCVYQILRQYPDKFEYNERFLRRLLYHVYSTQYGTFLFNSEHERVQKQLSKRTRSVWDYFLARKTEFINPDFVNVDYNESFKFDNAESYVLFPNPKDVKWWATLLGRTDQEMNISLDLDISRGSTPTGERSLKKSQVNLENSGYSSSPELSAIKSSNLSKFQESEGGHLDRDPSVPVLSLTPGPSAFPTAGFSRYGQQKQQQRQEQDQELEVEQGQEQEQELEQERVNRLERDPDESSEGQTSITPEEPVISTSVSTSSPSPMPDTHTQPLANTLVTYTRGYKEGEDDHYESQFNLPVRFNSMSLDLSPLPMEESQPTDIVSLSKRTASTFAESASTLAEDLIARFTGNEAGRTSSFDNL